MLSPDFINKVNDFKKLTFSDTKYHRGARPFNPLDNSRYTEDLDNAKKILKKIIPVKKESKKTKPSGAKKDTSSKKGSKKTKKESGTKK